MLLINLPAEVLLCITEETSSANDLISLLQTCRYLHNLLARYVGRIHGSSALLCAARDNWLSQIEKCLLHTGTRYINTPTRALYTRQTRSPLGSPLCIAAAHESVLAVEMLLEAGADVNFRDRYGRTPLALAVEYSAEAGTSQHNLLAVVDQLVSYGADVNIPGRSGRTPLMHAVMKGNEHLVCALLEAGAQLWVEPERLASITEFEDVLFAQQEEEESGPSDLESITNGEDEDREPDDQEKVDLWYLDMDVRRQEMGLAWYRDRMWPLLEKYGALVEH